jgi:hypothetical protein
MKRVAARSAQPDDVPHVLDLILAARNQKAAEIHRPAVLDDRTADESPGGVIASR